VCVCRVFVCVCVVFSCFLVLVLVQVSPFHSNGATAAVQAAEMTGGDEVPKMVTSPRYAATLGQVQETLIPRSFHPSHNLIIL
jgi:hypothetical protein